MRVNRFFLHVKEKTLPLHGTCTTSSPGQTKNRPLPWSAEEDARGRRAGTTSLRHRGTSLSWRGRRTAPRKTDGDVAEGPPPCRTSP
jgi:hypothetical protein